MNLQALKALQRKHWLMIIGGLTAAIVAGLLWGISSSLNRLGNDSGVPAFMRRAGAADALYAQIEARRKSIADENAVAQRFEARKAVLAGMRSDIDAARKRLPTEIQKAEVRQLIEDLARQVGSGTNALVIKSVAIREAAQSTGRKAAVSNYQTVEYQTSISTDMDGLIQFINLIERNERFMTVDGVQLTAGGVTTDKKSGKVQGGTHGVQLRIVTYIDTSARQAVGKK